jgi:hypothetical protein
MSKIKFDNGFTVNFEGDPTLADIEEVAKKLGLKGPDISSQNSPENNAQPEDKSLLRKVGDLFTRSEQALAETYGGAAATLSKDVKAAQEIPIQEADAERQLVDAIIKNRQEGKDSTRLENALKNLKGTPNANIEDIVPALKKTTKQIAGESLGVITDILGAGTLGTKGAAQLANPSIKKAMWEGAKLGAGWGAVGSAATAMRENKSTSEILKDTAIGGATGAALGGLIMPAGAALVGKIKLAIAPSVEAVTGKVKEAFLKGAKPLLTKMGTPAKRDEYLNKAVDAVDLIYKNRNKILLPDKETGEKIAGQIPKNLAEFSDAIDQAKGFIFSAYDNLAQSAKIEKKVDGVIPPGKFFGISDIVADLKRASSDIKLNPQTRSYAEKLIPEVSELRGQPATVIQERIKDLNNSLLGFYEGRTAKAKAQIDVSVAEKLRSKLDNFIEESTGKSGYKELKKAYGALKTIERDVNRRALAVSKLQEKSLVGGMTDVFSGGEFVMGILMRNPAIIGRAMGMKAAANYVKYLNSADRQVKLMFNLTKKANELLESGGKAGKVIDKAAEIMGKNINKK